MRKGKKKILAMLLTAIMVVSVMITGCGGEEKKTETTAKTEEKNAYAELEGVYKANVSAEGGMSVDLFLKIDDKGQFVFSRDTNFENKEKGAGYIEKNEEGKDTFVYTELAEAEVKEGEKVSEFEITDKGEIQFVTEMWFGSTHPRFPVEGKPDTYTYPLFKLYDEKAAKAESKDESKAETKETESKAETKETKADDKTQKETNAPANNNTPTPAPAPNPEPVPTPEPTPEPEPEVPQSNFREGTYYGAKDRYVDAMNSNAHYDITLSLSGGSYTYTVTVTITGGMEHTTTETYYGSYTVSGDHLDMTGTLYGADADGGGGLTISGQLSSFASGSDSATLY